MTAVPVEQSDLPPFTNQRARCGNRRLIRVTSTATARRRTVTTSHGCVSAGTAGSSGVARNRGAVHCRPLEEP
jgi:hypothetical protein